MITEYTVPLYCSMLPEKPLMTQVMMTAPMMPPQMLLSPPTSIMTMGSTEAENEKFCGETAPYTKANRPPAMPQNTALKTKASSFQLALRTPRVEEAISLMASAAERPAHPVLEQPGQEQQDDDGDDPDQVVLAHLGVELEPEEVERLHRAEAVGAAAPFPLEHDGQEDLPQAHGGQGQVEVLELEHRAADDQGHEPGGGGAGHPGQRTWARGT